MPRSRFTSSDLLTMQGLRRKDTSWAEIGRQFGISASGVKTLMGTKTYKPSIRKLADGDFKPKDVAQSYNKHRITQAPRAGKSYEQYQQVILIRDEKGNPKGVDKSIEVREMLHKKRIVEQD